MKNIFLTLFICTGMGCSSFVKTPEVHEIKKIAILSVFASDRVVEMKGRGSVQNWDQTFKMQVAEDALKTYQANFGKLGWSVVNPQKVLASAAYKKAFNPSVAAVDTGNETANKAINFLGGIARTIAEEKQKADYFTPAGMYPIHIADKTGNCYGNACPPDPGSTLADLAKGLGVDAVAVVQVDYCYEGGTFTSLGGAGEAFMTAATSIKVVNKKGDLVVNMPNLSMCDKSPNRAPSINSMLMNGGNLVFAFSSKEKIRALFKQSTLTSAKLAIEQIQAEF